MARARRSGITRRGSNVYMRVNSVESRPIKRALFWGGAFCVYLCVALRNMRGGVREPQAPDVIGADEPALDLLAARPYTQREEEEHLLEDENIQLLVERSLAHWTGTSYQMNATGLTIMPHYFGSPSKASIDKREVSIMTQMGVSRFPRLLDMRTTWKSYISVAVFCESKDALDHFEKLWNASPLKGDGKISVHIVLSTSYTGDYCINLMRNVAMDNAVTDYVFLLDGDFCPSPNTDAALYSFIPSYNLSRTALIVPAFERYDSPNLTVHDLVSTRQELKRHILGNPEDNYAAWWRTEELLERAASERHLYAPAAPNFPPAQFPTNFTRWFDATEPYKVQYEAGFEPYVVIEKATVPRFWEHFTGFGMDKASWFEELHLAGYEFVVLPDIFVTHINHPQSQDYLRVIKPNNTYQYTRQFQPYLYATYGHVLFKNDKSVLEWENILLSIYDDVAKASLSDDE